MARSIAEASPRISYLGCCSSSEFLPIGDRYARFFDFVRGSQCFLRLRGGALDCLVVTVPAASETKPAGAGGAGIFVHPPGAKQREQVSRTIRGLRRRNLDDGWKWLRGMQFRCAGDVRILRRGPHVASGRHLTTEPT